MPRTPIPKHLIHQPDEVERDGKRFDYLCRLAEEVASPVVRRALFREFHETATTGAEILSEEARHALETLAEDAAILEDLDEETMLQSLQKSLSEAVPPPDDEECRQHTRDFSQVLMSTWIESLRTAQAEVSILELSEYLLPDDHSSKFAWLKNWFASSKSKLPETVTDAVASFAVNEDDIIEVLTTLRDKLFAEPRLVDLPFDLAMVGAPGETVAAATAGGRITQDAEQQPARVMVMSRPFFDRLYQTMEQYLPKHEAETHQPIQFASAEKLPLTRAQSLRELAPHTPGFASNSAQLAAEKLSVPLLPSRYRVLAEVAALSPAKLQPAKLETSVRNVAAAI